MKKFEIVDLIELIKINQKSVDILDGEQLKKWEIYFNLNSLIINNKKFFEEKSFFLLSKRKYSELNEEINKFFHQVHILNSDNQVNFDKLGTVIEKYEIINLKELVSSAFLILHEEAKDAMVFNIESIGIYDVKKIFDKASDRFYENKNIPEAAILEYDEAGRCLILARYTACGFHSLRSLEIMIKHYLNKFGKGTENLKSWYDYVKALSDLQKDDNASGQYKPSKKVSSMIDRLREIDRNPLMHPEDNLNLDSADSLFSLCWITLTEMARDLRDREDDQSKQLIVVTS